MRPRMVSDDGFVLGQGPFSVGVGSLTLLKDTFTGADGTALDSHTMDVGPGWTLASGTWTIQSNRASDTDGGVAYSEAGQKDVTITGTVQENSGGVSGFVCRLTDGSNFWLGGISDGAVSIYEVVSGSFTQRATVTGTINQATDYTLTVTVSGSTITASANGVQCSYGSMSSNLTAAKCGLRKGGAAGTDTFDNFEVTG